MRVKKKIIVMLALIPMLTFMAVPVATVTAVNPSHYVQIFVGCWSNYYYGGTSAATVTYAGHTVSVSCAPGDENYNSICVYVTHSYKFVSAMSNDGQTQYQAGRFGPYQGAINGHSYGWYDDYAEWFIGTPPVFCGG
jgi:hypothetical protein